MPSSLTLSTNTFTSFMNNAASLVIILDKSTNIIMNKQLRSDSLFLVAFIGRKKILCAINDYAHPSLGVCVLNDQEILYIIF